jgi:hypothetical protein
MSASPGSVSRSGEELDLLLSRSLDGDLTPEEERELAMILAADPNAARRRDELAALVGRLGALPAPAAPLGLTARVGARAADQAKGTGAIWQRLGIFPPPGVVRGAAALFVIVLIGINVLRSQSARQKAAEEVAKRDEGRVAIFLGEKKESPPAPEAPAAEPPAKANAARSVSAPRPDVAIRQAESSASGKDERASDRSGAPEPLAKNAPARPEGFAAEVPALQEKPQEAAGALRNEGTPPRMLAAPAPPARAVAPAGAPLAWDVEIVGPSARAWAIRRIAAPPPSASGVSATYRVKLDADGKVVSVRAVEGAAPEAEDLVKSLVFTPIGHDPPAEIEVTVRTR